MFHLLRHADHGHVGKVLTGREPGIHLSQAGRVQARALARRMAETRPDALFTSPRLRARETAGFVARATGRDIRVSPCLDEIDFGRWSGQAFEDLERDADWRRWNAERDEASTPAGETMGGVAARLTGLLDRLREGYPGGSVCLVSHSDVIKAGLCRYLGRPFQDVHEFEISPASVTTLVVDDRAASLLTLDACLYLEPEEVVH